MLEMLHCGLPKVAAHFSSDTTPIRFFIAIANFEFPVVFDWQFYRTLPRYAPWSSRAVFPTLIVQG